MLFVTLCIVSLENSISEKMKQTLSPEKHIFVLQTQCKINFKNYLQKIGSSYSYHNYILLSSVVLAIKKYNKKIKIQSSNIANTVYIKIAQHYQQRIFDFEC